MKKIFTHILIATFLSVPVLVLADIGLKNPIGLNSISELILAVTRIVRYIAIPFIVIAIMYSGWLFVWEAARGGKNYQTAKDSLYYTIIGAFILLSAELIAIVMKNTVTSLAN